MHDRPSQQIESWLLSLLRYAISRREVDRAVVDALAQGLDSLGSRFDSTAFDFFSRSSTKLCNAIGKSDAGACEEIDRFLRQIESQPLRDAFEAALEFKCDEPAKETRTPKRASRQWLWKGLPKRDGCLPPNADAS